MSALTTGQQLQEGASPRSLHNILVVLRVVLGALMLEAGLTKLLGGGFSISGYVSHGSGPFAALFADFATASTGLSPVVMWGETLIGLALISGLFLRFASYWGMLMMVLYYLPYLPPTDGWISKQVIYLFVYLTLIYSGSGYYFGLDKFATDLEARHPGLRWILG